MFYLGLVHPSIVKEKFLSPKSCGVEVENGEKKGEKKGNLNKVPG